MQNTMDKRERVVSQQVAIIDAPLGYVLVTPCSESGSRPYTSVKTERVIAFEVVCQEREGPYAAGTNPARYLQRIVKPIGVNGNSGQGGAILMLIGANTPLVGLELAGSGKVMAHEAELLAFLNEGNELS